MRLISDSPGYKFQARPQRQRSLGDGGVEVTQVGVYCEFLPVYGGAMIYQNEVAAALKHFDFRGNTQEQDEATPTDPVMRLSVYDSDEDPQLQGDSELKKEVEDRLILLSQEAPNEVLLVSDKPIEAPFPNYDTWDGDPEELVERLVEDGWNLDQILYYERVFGPKRETVEAAIEARIELGKESVVEA